MFERKISTPSLRAPAGTNLHSRSHRVDVSGGLFETLRIPGGHIPLPTPVEGVDLKQSADVVGKDHTPERRRGQESVGQEHGKLHVLQGSPASESHSKTIACQFLRGSGQRENPHGPASGQHNCAAPQQKKPARGNVQGYTTHHTLRVTEQVHHHSVFQHGYAHAPHPAGEKPRQLESRDPQTTGIGMARGVDESFQTRSPVQQLLHPNRGLFGVDGHQPLVGEIVPLLDHVAGELLWAIVRRALYSEDFAGATACLLYTSPSPRDRTRSRMPSSA